MALSITAEQWVLRREGQSLIYVHEAAEVTLSIELIEQSVCVWYAGAPLFPGIGLNHYFHDRNYL